MLKVSIISIVLICFAAIATAQTPASMALSPARFELEMRPGTETTVVVDLDYRSDGGGSGPARIMASLNDWSITEDGRVEYFKPNSRAGSASPWVIYSPGEAQVLPGTVHQIRVTIVVPENAAPGDHLTALIVEQRPDALKTSKDARQVVVRYRMASVFYIKVAGLTKQGSLDDLYARSTPEGIVVTPTLRNAGNSMIRPEASLKIIAADGRLAANVHQLEPLPILAGSATRQPIVINEALAPGSYTVKYRIDFQDGGRPTEGVTDLVVGNAPQIAASGKRPATP